NLTLNMNGKTETRRYSANSTEFVIYAEEVSGKEFVGWKNESTNDVVSILTTGDILDGDIYTAIYKEEGINHITLIFIIISSIIGVFLILGAILMLEKNRKPHNK
ncbi:MAG: hypothetical protein K5765_06090, partial [Clostridia bacterium]|nr:hypothetical protein [Clostridia bacterium]